MPGKSSKDAAKPGPGCRACFRKLRGKRTPFKPQKEARRQASGRKRRGKRTPLDR